MTRKKIILIFTAIFLLFAVPILCFLRKAPDVPVKNFGVTFSKMQADYLGLNWQKVYESIFTDLNIKLVRVPVYWQEVEKEKGNYDFSATDWMLQKANEYGGQVILVVGRKVPRWPECHEPEWAKNYPENEKQELILKIIRETVERSKDHPAVTAFQVENEPFLNFGVCPPLDVEFLDKEISLVRQLSDKPVVISDSGEFGMWFRAYPRADIFGTTMYRKVYNKVLGQITYPLPPSFFRLKKGIIETIYGEKSSVVIELQAEAWGSKLVYEVSTEENYRSFNPEEFKKILEYIKGTGFDTFYFWGVEWWYYLKQNGHPEMWDIAKEAIKNVK